MNSEQKIQAEDILNRLYSRTQYAVAVMNSSGNVYLENFVSFSEEPIVWFDSPEDAADARVSLEKRAGVEFFIIEKTSHISTVENNKKLVKDAAKRNR